MSIEISPTAALESGSAGMSHTESAVDHVRNGFADLAESASMWRLWTMLGWNDIRQRYRRSTLGPFWITISMAIFTLLLGVIYSRIFNQELAVFLPYIAMGLITWGFISGTTVEATGSFIEGAGIIKQIRLPLTIYPMRTIWRSFIILLHTIVLIVPITIIFQTKLGWEALLVFPGLLLVFLNQIWVTIVIAILTTRFRDIVQLVATAMQIAMFATPIMWPVSALRDGHIIADVNPLYHLIDLVRAPLLGQTPSELSWLVVIGMCLAGYITAAFLLGRTSRRIVYWL